MQNALLAQAKCLFHILSKAFLVVLLFLAAPLFAERWTDPATGVEWMYSISSGEAEITRVLNVSGHFTIPSSIKGYRVTAIGWFALADCTGLTSVTIPDSVRAIGTCAFKGCTGLTSVTIPDSVRAIGAATFSGCTNLTSVIIHDGVTTIGFGMFGGCTSLTSVTIPDSVTKIENFAFEGCTSLTSVTIPDSVTTINFGAFAECGAVFVDKGNNAYLSTPEGALLSADGHKLLHVPASVSSYIIPDCVTEIWGAAFWRCRNLTSVTIPDSVTKIGICAFWECIGLTSVTIPASVTEVEEQAFWGCTNLRTAYILNRSCEIHPEAFKDSPTEIILGRRLLGLPLSWIYVAVAILVVVGGLLGIGWWYKRRSHARQN